MRIGEQLGVRWDFAFYQMIVETGSLSYRRGNRAGDVKPPQNNFAGLGATGGGEPGESFKDIATGVRAHLEHLLLYAGRQVDNPIAERTRKVQEWGVLTKWQQRFKRPITFADLAAKWAPGSNGYVKMLEAVAERFRRVLREARSAPRAGAGGSRQAQDDGRHEGRGGQAGAPVGRRAGTPRHRRRQGGTRRPALRCSARRRHGKRSRRVPFKVLNAPQAAGGRRR